jgi:hypothetical protein
VSDASRTNRAVFGPVRVQTENQAEACAPQAGPSPVLARWRGSRRTTRTLRGGRHGVIVGRVEGAGAGATVVLLARELRDGASAQVVATTTTAQDGSYTLRVPTGPSRQLQAAHRARATDRTLVCSPALAMRVPARVSLRVRPRSVRPGGRIRVRGRLVGGHVPARGKLVDLQARDGGRWRLVDTVRARASGRFRAGYRFTLRAARKRYPLRARVRPESGYPFALGYSRVVRVRVR